MDGGLVPPETGAAANNPDGVWSMDAQLETESFGLISPGQPGTARDRAGFFARVTNSGLAVDVSVFYAHLYAQAFFESDIDVLLEDAVAAEADGPRWRRSWPWSEAGMRTTRMTGAWHGP